MVFIVISEQQHRILSNDHKACRSSDFHRFPSLPARPRIGQKQADRDKAINACRFLASDSLSRRGRLSPDGNGRHAAADKAEEVLQFGCALGRAVATEKHTRQRGFTGVMREPQAVPVHLLAHQPGPAQPTAGQRADHAFLDLPELVFALQVDRRRHGKRRPGPSWAADAEQSGWRGVLCHANRMTQQHCGNLASLPEIGRAHV